MYPSCTAWRVRENAGDHGLRRNDRGCGRQWNERDQQLGRSEKIERIGRGFRIGQQQCALPEVVEHQRGQGNREPRELNRRVTKVTKIGVQCFATRDDQEDGAQHEQPTTRILRQEPNGVRREHRTNDGRIAQYPIEAKHGNRGEPDQHDRPEHRAHPSRPPTLKHEQTHEDGERDPDDPVLQLGRRNLETLDRREHRNRGSQCAVGIEQRRAKNAEHDHQPPRRQPAHRAAPVHERHEGEHAAFALVVGADDHYVVLHGDDE